MMSEMLKQEEIQNQFMNFYLNGIPPKFPTTGMQFMNGKSSHAYNNIPNGRHKARPSNLQANNSDQKHKHSNSFTNNGYKESHKGDLVRQFSPLNKDKEDRKSDSGLEKSASNLTNGDLPVITINKTENCKTILTQFDIF